MMSLTRLYEVGDLSYRFRIRLRLIELYLVESRYQTDTLHPLFSPIIYATSLLSSSLVSLLHILLIPPTLPTSSST